MERNMQKVNLIGYQVHEVNFTQNLAPGVKIQFENGYTYNAKYSKDNICRGEMKITVRDKEDEKRFHLALTIVGLFRYDLSMAKEDIHAQSFKQLFPYAKAYIATITAAGGMAPVNIPTIDIDDKAVYRLDLHPGNT